jgi:hypothetical protein
VVTLHHASTWKIAVYGREHGIPHFHVEGRGFRCSIAIETLDLIIGDAPHGVLRMARIWAREHQRDLLVKWLELNE